MRLPYFIYRWLVVRACVELMGRENKAFFDGCDFREEWKEDQSPQGVAWDQRDSILSSL